MKTSIWDQTKQWFFSGSSRLPSSHGVPYRSPAPAPAPGLKEYSMSHDWERRWQMRATQQSGQMRAVISIWEIWQRLAYLGTWSRESKKGGGLRKCTEIGMFFIPENECMARCLSIWLGVWVIDWLAGCWLIDWWLIMSATKAIFMGRSI